MHVGAGFKPAPTDTMQVNLWNVETGQIWITPMSKDTVAASIEQARAERFGERIAVDPALGGLAALEKIAAYRSHRQFLPRSIEPELLRLLCACALSAPSKSDLQQSDILIVNDMAIRKGIVATIPDMPWINE